MTDNSDDNVATEDNDNDDNEATTNNVTMKTMRAVSHANGDNDKCRRALSLLRKSPIHPPAITTTHHPFWCTGSHTQPVTMQAVVSHMYYYINIY